MAQTSRQQGMMALRCPHTFQCGLSLHAASLHINSCVCGTASIAVQLATQIKLNTTYMLMSCDVTHVLHVCKLLDATSNLQLYRSGVWHFSGQEHRSADL